jgi:predicted transcriptional regulator
VVLDESESVSNALKVMHKKGATRIAVVKHGQLVGMLTEKAVSGREGLAVKPRASKK